MEAAGGQQALEQAIGTSMALNKIWMPEDRLEPAGDEAMKKLCPNLTPSEGRLTGPFAITLDMAPALLVSRHPQDKKSPGGGACVRISVGMRSIRTNHRLLL